MYGVELMCKINGHFLLLFLALSLACKPIHADEDVDSLIAKKKWPEAVILLRSIVRKDPHATGAQVDLARALIYQGRREEALTVLAQAIGKARGKKRDWLIQQSRVFSRLFVTNVTFQIYQEGLNLLMIQKYRQAREQFEKALTAESSNVEILTRLGQAYLMDGDHDSAAEQLKVANRLDPYEPEIRLWLGRSMHLRGELNEGIDMLKAAYADMKTSEIAPVWVADALEAMQVLEDDTKNNPLHVMSLVNVAKLKAQGADHNSETLWSARKDFQNALSRLPDYLARNRMKTEGELGLGYPIDGKEIKDEIQSSLQKLQGKLEELKETTTKGWGPPFG
jgi:tetratricopeptide (TPR) repeat protein